MKTVSRKITLASSSRYRRELLLRLVKTFDQTSPEIDESLLDNEIPQAYVQRLACEKAEAVRKLGIRGLIIASDQCAVTGGRVLGKPGSHEPAVAQLSACSGRQVQFLTGLALLDSDSGLMQVECDEVLVKFRDLSTVEIEQYLKTEQPYDCAGSFKCEGLGIALFESITSSDPNSLVGLPLIRLNKMLIRFGVNPLLL